MDDMIRTIVVVLVLAVACGAQHASAPNGYYPETYGGSTYQGMLESVDPAKQEFTLLFRKKDKEERFTGILEDGCAVPNAAHKSRKMKVEDLPKQSTLVAFFMPRTIKQNDGTKSKVNSVFAVSFRELDGQKINPEHWTIYYCMQPTRLVFRAY
jgi:hypothetical protein